MTYTLPAESASASRMPLRLRHPLSANCPPLGSATTGESSVKPPPEMSIRRTFFRPVSATYRMLPWIVTPSS